MRAAAGLSLIAGLFASDAYAVDGVLEINQACAEGAGCFAGDTAGFPVQITTRGSYRLTSNLTPPNQNTTAVSITAAGVSLDLNGLAIQGTNAFAGSGLPGACSAAGTGFGVDASAVNGAAISNGRVRGMGSRGIEVGVGSRVERVIAELNCAIAIRAGRGSLITDSLVRRNGDIGILAFEASRIQNTVVEFNRDRGIFVSSGGSVVEGCVANGNGATGIQASGLGSLVLDSMASNNGGTGIVVGNGSLVLRSSTNGNTASGIDAAADAGIGLDTANGNGTNVAGAPIGLACNVVGGAQSLCP